MVHTLYGEIYQAIIITVLEGVTLREMSGLADEQIERAYFKAGELTRVLHDKFKGTYFGRPDCAGKPIEIFHHEDPVYYMQQSILDALNGGKETQCFGLEELRLAEWALDRVDIFEGVVPCAVSWDSSPNNWIVSKKTGEFMGMIDFENMLWGFSVDNFTIMYERYFLNFPQGKNAFFSGYGLDILEEKEVQIKLACIKAGLSGIVWGTRFGDRRSVLLARRMLEELERNIV